MSHPHFSFVEFGNEMIIRLNDSVDTVSFSTVTDQIVKLLTERKRQRVLINIEPLDYIQSTALGRLAIIKKQIDGGDGQLGLCHGHPRCREIIELSKLDKVFNLFDNEQDALDEWSIESDVEE